MTDKEKIADTANNVENKYIKKLLDAIRNTTPKDDELSMYNIGGWD